jgi:hypothetical protein
MLGSFGGEIGSADFDLTGVRRGVRFSQNLTPVFWRCVVGNVELLKLVLAGQPLDVGVRVILADALDEIGDQDAAAYQRSAADWVGKLNKGEACVGWLPGPLVEELYLAFVSPESAVTVTADLKTANGRRRVRTLEPFDIVCAVVYAVIDQGGWWPMGGGTVANSYKYPAYRTVCVAARRSDGKVRVSVGVGSARKGASETSPVSFLWKNAGPEAFRRWADHELKTDAVAV